MSSTWYLAPSLNVLRGEIDAAHPHRQKKMDGTIGDAAHAARDSDHNPNARGSVNAIDVDEIGIDALALAWLRRRFVQPADQDAPRRALDDRIET